MLPYYTQTRNQGGSRGEKHPLENFSPRWKNVLDIFLKYWT